jgi:hypothetical protein
MFMKQTSKPATKKSAQKKPATKKPLSKPKRKAQGQPELAATLTSLVDGQAKLIERLAKLAAIAQGLVKTIEHLSEGVEELLQTSEGTSPEQQAKSAAEPVLEVPSGAVGVMVVDETENGDGEEGEAEEE